MAVPSFSIIVCTLDNTSGLGEFIKTLLRQEYYPDDLIVIHGRPDGDIKNQISPLLRGTSIRIIYATCAPGLVYQRNLGLSLCKSELALFFDDDVLLDEHYIRNLLDIYEKDTAKEIGGIQGLITNMPASPKLARLMKRFFLLYTGYGTGRLNRSGTPSFLSPDRDREETQFFAGCLMSFRMEAIGDLVFDEKLHPYWWGDDFEFCYRVSQRRKLIQITDAKLVHKGSSVNKNSFRRFWRMQVVNHFYIFEKYRRWYDFPFYLWSLSGNFLFSILQVFKGYGFDGLLGYFEGIGELIGISGSGKNADVWDRDLIKISYLNTESETEKDEWKTAKI